MSGISYVKSYIIDVISDTIPEDDPEEEEKLYSWQQIHPPAMT